MYYHALRSGYRLVRPSPSIIRSSIGFQRPRPLALKTVRVLCTNVDKEKDKKQPPVASALWEDAINIPNALTMTRILATPGICYWIMDEQYTYAIVGFWVAGFLDWVDGYLARKWNQMSIFGSFLDPLADKVFVGGTLLTLTAKGLIPWPLLVLIVGRDAGLVLGSFYIRAKTRKKGDGFFDMGEKSGVVAVEASTISKFNTLFQFGLIWFTLTHCAWNIPPEPALPALWAISGGSTFFSGYDYYRRANWKNIFKPADQASKPPSEKNEKQP